MSPCAFDHGLRRGVAVLCQKPLFQASGIHADADGDIALSARLGNGLDILVTADIAGVYPYLIDAASRRFERKTVVKVDIGDKRDIDLFFDSRHRLGRRHIRYGDADNVAAGCLELLYLRNGCFNIVRFRIAHRLHRDLGVSADRYAADNDLFCFVSLIHVLPRYKLCNIVVHDKRHQP